MKAIGIVVIAAAAAVVGPLVAVYALFVGGPAWLGPLGACATLWGVVVFGLAPMLLG